MNPPFCKRRGNCKQGLFAERKSVVSLDTVVSGSPVVAKHDGDRSTVLEGIHCPGERRPNTTPGGMCPFAKTRMNQKFLSSVIETGPAVRKGARFGIGGPKGEPNLITQGSVHGGSDGMEWLGGLNEASRIFCM